MSRGVNKVILIGNLGADPDVRYTAQGEAVANLRLATSERWTDRQSGERKEHTEWHGVVLFRRLGEIAGEYLRKGARVYIEGKLRTRQWQDRDGQDRYTTEIVARELQMLEARQRLDDGGRLDLPAPSAGAGRGNGQPPPPAQRNAQQLPPVDFDDDIPF